MHKKITSILTLLILLFLFSFTPVKAQENTVSVWNCLPAKKDGVNKIKLFQKDLYQKDKVYIVDCIGTPAGSYCSTGNKEDNEKLKIGMANIEFPFVLDDPAAIKDKKTSDFTVTVDFAKIPLHNFYYVYLDTVDAAKTIKFASINFTGDTCANTVSAIPSYRFFDIASLEPVSEVRVSSAGTSGTSIEPPQLTRADGGYYPVYADKNSKLKFEVSKEYSFTNQVNPSSLKKYKSNYDNFVKKTYTDTDIAIVPNGAARIKPPEAIFYTVARFEKFTRVQGRISIPHSIVTFSQGDVEIQRIKADRFGDYSINIENSKIDVEQALQMSYIKANLLSSNVANVQGIAINQGPEIVPISKEIEGYVYDSAGNIIPEGIVEVRLRSSDKVYYTTKGNKDGYFKITAERLPKFEYYLTIYASEASINVYNYSDEEVQTRLVNKMMDKAKRDLKMGLSQELLKRTTYLDSSSIFKNDDASTIAKKTDVVTNQKAVSTYLIKLLVDKGESSKYFGTDINQVPQSEFKAKVQKDLTVLFENKEARFLDEFSQYYTDLVYSQELIGLVSGNGKDAFAQKMIDHLVNDIFGGNKLLSLGAIENSKDTRVLAAAVAPPTANKNPPGYRAIDTNYLAGGAIAAVGSALTSSILSGGNLPLGVALANSGKALATGIISQGITNVVGNNIASAALTGVVGAVISGGDVGRSVTTAARAWVVNQGAKALTVALVKPVINAGTGKITDAAGKMVAGAGGMSPTIAGPIVGFLATFIMTGDVKQAAVSAISAIAVNVFGKVVTTFLTNTLTGLGLATGTISALATMGIGLVVALLLKLFGCS